MNRQVRAERGRFAPLAHTGPEAQAVGHYFWDFYGREAQVLTGKDATEGRLKTIAQPPRALHLATHGFFLAGRADPGVGESDRPMTLAGVALAGANLGLDGQVGPDGQDGILYALEAGDLNLEGTELATLSACDTGKGELDRSEGVYGLVRAFQIAGARQVMMTLWPLNDPLARAFMDDFYRAWLGAAEPTRPFQALRKTQIEWIGSADERKRDPRYWAPFVLVERG